MRESIKSKLKGNKSKLKTDVIAGEETIVQKKPQVDEEEEEEEEYYLGKDRKDERKKQAYVNSLEQFWDLYLHEIRCVYADYVTKIHLKISVKLYERK